MDGEYQYQQKVTRREEAPVPGQPVCPFCGTPFRQRRTGGSDQRFCRSACRNAFWSAARQWVWKAIAAGLLTPAAIREASMHAGPDSAGT